MSLLAFSPFEYIRDDARRRIRITARRTLQRDDLLAIVDRQLHEDTWTFGMLYDLRMTSGATLMADALTVAAHVKECLTTHGPRGPVALVTQAAQMVAAGHIYAYHGAKSGQNIEVFWDPEEAEQWLDRQLTY